MACVVLGLMHTGTNVWHAIKGCHGGPACRNYSNELWKHIPVSMRTINELKGCQIYVTYRPCDVWETRMKQNHYEYAVHGNTITGFNRGFGIDVTAKHNPKFAAALAAKPLTFHQMCLDHYNATKALEAKGLVKVLHFKDVCSQKNRPTMDARPWIKRKGKCGHQQRARRTQ